MDKRREAEAAEAIEAAPKKKKKATKKKAAAAKKKTTRKRVKAKTSTRKRLVWGVFNGNMKEEGRFPYHERAAAEEKLKKLQVKSPKRMFFIQPIKEEIAEAPAADEEE
ncbi:MAG: hypothetical protein ACE5KM_04855 [Planctomycetaceae bacterium]